MLRPALFQSARKRSRPESVMGCLNIISRVLSGMVATWAPARIDSRTCSGWRTEATRTSLSKP